jgi:membrane associated rhomboid family serine protease
MKMNKAPFRSGPNQKSGGPSMVTIIIILNVIAYLVSSSSEMVPYRFLMDGRPTQMLIQKWVLDFSLITPKVMGGQVYRLVSCMFLHGGFMHILFNMWGVFLFGRMIEQQIGKSRFLLLYFISGILGSVIWLFANSSGIPCIGASGAVFGLAIGAAMLFPDLRIMLMFPPIPMKLKTFAIVYILIEVFMEFSKVDEVAGMGGIAHIVHLGGALGGYIYLRIACSKEIRWDLLPSFRSGKSSSYEVPSGWSMSKDPESGDRVSQKELDRLLDKISETGINSLTPEEEETLRCARDQMKRQ